MPAFASLSNKAKILVYLVALQGWRFVVDEPMPSDARPADIEAATRIPGGSLRPVLRGLSENHHVSEKDSHYSIRGTSLPAIEAELNGGDERVVVRHRPSGRKSLKGSSAVEAVDEEDNESAADTLSAEEGAAADGEPTKSRKVGSKTGNVAATFERWIDEGYFDEPRTLSDVQKRFRKEAIMVPQTSLPGYFLAAVRKGRLTRDEVEANGKTVWAYTTGANGKVKVTQMRAIILASLQRGLEPTVAQDIIDAHDKLLGEFRKGDVEAALNASGKFVEHVLRAIEHLRTGALPTEIKSLSSTIKAIENDGALPESLRVLVPRISSAMMFDVRSKRGAAHVKEISPRHIDASLATLAASWVVAEFVRLYHTADETAVAEAMASLMQGNLPLIEKFEDEMVVTTPLHPETEVLLMVSASEPDGIDRKGLGMCVKHSAVAVTRAVQKLEGARHIHMAKSGAFHITGPGERALLEQLAKHDATPMPRRARC